MSHCVYLMSKNRNVVLNKLSLWRKNTSICLNSKGTTKIRIPDRCLSCLANKTNKLQQHPITERTATAGWARMKHSKFIRQNAIQSIYFSLIPVMNSSSWRSNIHWLMLGMPYFTSCPQRKSLWVDTIRNFFIFLILIPLI